MFERLAYLAFAVAAVDVALTASLTFVLYLIGRFLQDDGLISWAATVGSVGVVLAFSIFFIGLLISAVSIWDKR